MASDAARSESEFNIIRNKLYESMKYSGPAAAAAADNKTGCAKSPVICC